MRKIAAVIGLMICSSLAWGQQEKPGVKVVGKATNRSIKIRWAPNSPSAWQLANKYGYTVERVTLTENKKVLKDPPTIILNDAIFKPADEQYWVNPMDEDDYVAVAAQAIFGETFELTENYSSDIAQVVNKTRELEQRFSFALFAADQSVRAAELSGLYFEDELIAPNAKYLYRVYANIPREIVELDTGFVFLGMEDFVPLPAPFDVTAEFDDHSALITWDGSLVEKTYGSFWVERSEDGVNFEPITKEPVLNTFQGNKPHTKRIFKLDSLPSNDKVYYYRVKGIDAFGDVGPPSDTLSGSGKPIFAHNARISGHEILDEGPVRVDWEFPEEGLGILEKFTLKRYHPKTKTYSTILENIDKGQRSAMDPTPRSSNYYIISSTDQYGRGNESFPYFVQLEDSIPPVQPKGLLGDVDTTGLVSLRWEANTDPDILGYKLFKSNFKTHEFIQVPGPVITSTSYTDTISLKNLTETIYYKVQALDLRFNPSEFSEPLKLKKPDLVPPSAPVFKEIKGDSLGILISWEASTSEDLFQHVLYRRAQNEPNWKVVKVINLDDNVNFYLDREVNHRTAYAYTIIAVDDDRLESAPADPVSLMFIDNEPYPAVSQVFYNIDKSKRAITVSWNYSQQNATQFLIYKSINGGPLKLMKTVSSDQKEINDDYNINDLSLEYRVVAAFDSGDKTKLAEGVKIEL